MSNFLANFLARAVALPTSAANLRTEASAKYVAGETVVVPIAGVATVFAWDTASTATDDGIAVIRPTDIAAPDPGRFLRLATQAVPHPSRTLYVDLTYAGSATDGGVATPFKTLQAAVNAVPAGTFGVSQPWLILAAPGDYAEVLVTLASQQIIIAPLGIGTEIVLEPSLIQTTSITFVTNASVNQPMLLLRSVKTTNLTVSEAAVPATSGILSVTGCDLAGISSAVGIYSGIALIVDTVISANVSLAGAAVRSRNMQCNGTFAVLAWFDEGAIVGGAASVAAASAAPTMALTNSDVLGLVTCASTTELSFSGSTVKTLAKNGALGGPTLVTNSNRWKGDATYYSTHHTVRDTNLSPTLNLLDDYVILRPASGVTIAVTLPDARLFVGNGYSQTETNGGTVRTPARHLTIKNASEFTDGYVTLAPGSGAQRIDSNVMTGMMLLQGETHVLVPVYNSTLAEWSWESLQTFGKNYLYVVSAAESTDVTGAFVTKATITTPALRGTYRVEWHVVAYASAVGTRTETQLYNTTAAAVLGVTLVADVVGAFDRVAHSGVELVSFGGAAKTLEIQFRRGGGAGTAKVSTARLELWKVQQ